MKSYLRFLLSNVRGDLFGGITTGIVALPLALALGVASGAGAAAGLYSAIFQGTIAAIFGGAPAQVSGPTAGMTAVLIGIYLSLGTKGLFAAMFLGGVFQLILAVFRLGKYIHYLPKPVVVGFTNGIAVLIFWKQFKDIFMPGGPMHTPIQMALAAGVVLLIVIWPRITRAIPGSLVALMGATAAVLLGTLPVKLLGPMPSGLPGPHFPLAGLDWSAAPMLIKAGLIVALLGTIESLLSAIVVDEMTGTRHRSDREIFGQGLANVIAPIFGGLAGTGAIVRSAVNARTGGRTPLAALVHSAMILGITVGLGKYAALIPVPALWGILIATAFGMVEWESVHDLLRAPKSDSAVMVVTTVLTVFEDLTVGVAAGLLLSFILFGLRMGRSPVQQVDTGSATILVLEGPLFFGMAKNFLDMVEAASEGVPQVWDFSRVTTVDATGAAFVRRAWREAERHGKKVAVVGLRRDVQRVLERLGVMDDWEAGTIQTTCPEALSTLGSAQTESWYPQNRVQGSDSQVFERILLAVDGSPHSERALTVAANFGKMVSGATVLVLHVLRPLAPDGLRENPLYYQDQMAREREKGEGLADSVRDRLAAEGIAATAAVRWGDPAPTVVKEAESWKADVVIMGSRGLSDWKGLVLGSTSHQAIQLSKCPVLVVK